MPDHAPRLVVGLGNPGIDYRDTRHNAGFIAIDVIAAAHNIPVASGTLEDDIWFVRGRMGNKDVIIAKPLNFMNRSGLPVYRLADRLDIRCENLLVVHDDIDLVLGRVKIKEKGGDGGHRGILSLIDAFGRDDFARLRIGIGRPQPGISVTDHVLGRFSAEEWRLLGPTLDRVQEAVVSVLRDGTTAAMNRFNSI